MNTQCTHTHTHTHVRCSYVEFPWKYSGLLCEGHNITIDFSKISRHESDVAVLRGDPYFDFTHGATTLKCEKTQVRRTLDLYATPLCDLLQHRPLLLIIPPPLPRTPPHTQFWQEDRLMPIMKRQLSRAHAAADVEAAAGEQVRVLESVYVLPRDNNADNMYHMSADFVNMEVNRVITLHKPT
jgi:hypothetical protein